MLALNSWLSSCLGLQSAGIASEHYHTCVCVYFWSAVDSMWPFSLQIVLDCMNLNSLCVYTAVSLGS